MSQTEQNQEKSREGVGRKGQRSGEGRAVHPGKLVFSRLGNHVWGLLEHTLPRKPLGDLEQRPFQTLWQCKSPCLHPRLVSVII